jgi:hypothetical protein
MLHLANRLASVASLFCQLGIMSTHKIVSYRPRELSKFKERSLVFARAEERTQEIDKK